MPLSLKQALDLSDPADQISATLDILGLRVVARVAVDGGALDLVVDPRPSRLALVRMVRLASAADHSDLATMIAEGTFAFAALLYEERDGSVIEGPIAAFHVSEIDHLVARLVRETGA